MVSPRAAHLIGFELLVEWVQRVDTEIVHVQHDAKTELVCALNKWLGLRAQVGVVRIVAVIAVFPPIVEIEQGLRRIKASGQHLQDACVESHNDTPAHVLDPGWLLVGDGHRPIRLLKPLPIPLGRPAPVPFVSVETPGYALAAGQRVERSIVDGDQSEPPTGRASFHDESLESTAGIFRPHVESAVRAFHNDELDLPGHGVIVLECRARRIARQPQTRSARDQDGIVQGNLGDPPADPPDARLGCVAR